MRIALVHMRHRQTGGTERYLNQIASHLAEEGHETTIICRSREESPHPAVRFVVLRRFAPGGAARMWAFARAAQQHVRAHSYDVVFSLGKTWTHDVIRLGGGCQQTYLERAHAATLTPWERIAAKGFLKHRLALRIEQRALAPDAFVKVVTNSRMVKRDVMSRYGIADERVNVIYNGVDTGRFHPGKRRAGGDALRRSCGFAGDDRVVLFLGTGYGRKGLGPLLEAFAHLRRAERRTRLLVVGYDSSQARFERRAEELGLSSAVRFLGGRRDPEVCFGAADLYVLPTYYDPFANSTLEALASGLPVVTTEANGASELLTHRLHGSVLRNAGTDDLLEELRFWTAEDRARRASHAARSLAEQYGRERTVRATATLLYAIAEERPNRRR